MKRVFKNDAETLFIVDETETIFSKSDEYVHLYTGSAQNCEGYCDGYLDALGYVPDRRAIKYVNQ